MERPAPGLVPVGQSGAKRSTLSIAECAAVADAAAFNGVDYVFFRRFSDGRSSQVAAYVVDNSREQLDEQELAGLHQQLWLHGTAPLLYVAGESRLDVLACARGPDFWHDKKDQPRYNPVERLRTDIQTAAEINAEFDKRVRFSALRLADGTFWDDPRNSSLANHDKAAHQSLIQAVVDADKELEGDRRPVLRRLLLLTVLIKYLEDRGVFPETWFREFHKGAKCFLDVLKDAEPEGVQHLLARLERKFNGDVFRLSPDGKHALTRQSLDHFAELVEARTLGRQRYLWEQYTFRYLPVEILSHLYQRFVQGGHGTVYTPPFLASLLLDHAMPYDKLSGDERVLDPACGSGIFLVGAYKRLVNVWRSRHRWGRPDPGTLKGILRQSIFGVELDANAIDLTAFSLALAVCDALQPEVIWRDLKFDPLRKTNLIEADFFHLVLEAKGGKPTVLNGGFDVVVGNPPFESKLTGPGRELDKTAEPKRGTLPDKNAAYLFLEQTLDALGKTGHVCLIQPSSFLYNRKAEAFRTWLLENNRFSAVFDFTSIRKLYEADPKTIAVFAERRKPRTDHSIRHWTFRRTFSVHQRICFELDHYDRHRVSQSDAQSDPFVLASQSARRRSAA